MARNPGPPPGGGRPPQAAAPPAGGASPAQNAPPRESSGRISEPKKVLKAAGWVFGVGMLLLAAKPVYDVAADFFGGGGWMALGALAGLIVLGLLAWKKPVVFWAILIIVGLAAWGHYAPRRPKSPAEKPKVTRATPQARKEIVEMEVVSNEFRPVFGWQRGPWGATLVEFETQGGVEIWYGDEQKSDPHRQIPPGQGNIHDPGWNVVKPNALRLRSILPGTHKVKIIYTVPTR